MSLVVLYADIAGSTALYEEHGDERARETVAACLSLLGEVASKFGGRLVKTIGDEVMCLFHDPRQAVIAANEMQRAVRTASEGGRFATGRLRVKIGLHHGPGSEEQADVFGEAAIGAAGLVKMAKADEILTSGTTLQALPVELRVGSRFLDRAFVEGMGRELDVHELVWEVDELTQVADTRPERERSRYTRLTLSYGPATLDVGEGRPRVTLGRVEGNDLVVPSELTSRQHVEIEFRMGRFRLRDMSSNGTRLIPDGGSERVLRKERVPLEGSGRICLGGVPEANPEAVVRYRCE